MNDTGRRARHLRSRIPTAPSLLALVSVGCGAGTIESGTVEHLQGLAVAHFISQAKKDPGSVESFCLSRTDSTGTQTDFAEDAVPLRSVTTPVLDGDGCVLREGWLVDTALGRQAVSISARLPEPIRGGAIVLLFTSSGERDLAVYECKLEMEDIWRVEECELGAVS